MKQMRIRMVGVLAVLMTTAVITSAVVTCVPGGMAMPQMSSCMDASDQPSDQPCVSSGMALNCCTSPAPSLTAARADLVKAPTRHVLPWLTSMVALTALTTAFSVTSTLESPPSLTTSLGPPTYIVLSTLRV